MIVIVLKKFFFLLRLVTNAFCDAAEPWQLGFQDAATLIMEGIRNLRHDIFFFPILILVFVSRILVRALWHFNYKKNPIPQRIVHGTTIEILRTIFPSIIPMFIAIPSFLLSPPISFCDAVGGVDRPPTPPTVELPEAAVQAPEIHPQPAPPVVPEMEHPLLSNDVRSDILYSRYGIQNFGGDDGFRRMISIISNQLIVERSIEAALVDDGFHPVSILHRYRDIRQLLHSPRGELLSERTYRVYVSQIQEQGTRESVPYRRVIQAVRSSRLLLERADGRIP